MNPSIIILTTSLLLGFLFNYLFYGMWLGVNLVIFVVIILISTIVFLYSQKKKLKKFDFLLIFAVIFFSGMVAIRASYFLTFLNVVATIYLMLLLASRANGRRHRTLLDFISLGLLPFSFLAKSTDVLSSASRAKKGLKENKKVVQIIKGVLMALPVLFIFTLLFASADMIIDQYLKNIFDFKINAEIIARSLIVIIATIVFAGAFKHIIDKEKYKEEQGTNFIKPSLGIIEAMIFLWSIATLFLVFIIVQAVYLFGGVENISNLGFTYAEYARKGFFELLVVATLTYVIIYTTEKSLKKEKDSHSLHFKIAIVTLVFELLIILLSSFKRLFLYEEAFGFTLSRFYAHSILIWLGIIFLWFLYKIFVERHRRFFIHGVIISLFATLIVINAINPDFFIAKHNITRLEKTDHIQLDTWYLSTLSDDAIPTIIPLLDDNSYLSKDMKRNLANNLYNRLDSKLSSDSIHKWQSWNFSRNNAYNILKTIQPTLKETKDYMEQKMKEDIGWKIDEPHT